MVMIRMIIILIEHIFASPKIISMSNVSFISPLSTHAPIHPINLEMLKHLNIQTFFITGQFGVSIYGVELL